MSFINPAFLFAIGAAILPVLYHLVRKMRAKKVPFSSLMFLKATPKEIVRKRRLRDLLLMAVRSVIFALLALAFARPFIPKEQIPFISQREAQSVALLIDRSFSMQYGDWFEQAKNEALERIDQLASGDELTIIAFSDEAEQLTPLSTDRALHRNVVEGSLKPSNRPTDFYKPIRMAEEVLRGARHEDRVVIVLSDFQSNGWAGTFENWKLPSDDYRLVPVSLVEGSARNGYIEDFHLTKKRTGLQVALRYDARVTGAEDPEQHLVRLAVDKINLGEQRVTTSPGRVSFQQIAPREGAFQATLTLEEDDLAIDNRYYYTYSVEGRPRLLHIDGGSGNLPRDGFFLRNAFNLGQDSLYEFVSGQTQDLRPGNLGRFGTVFLSNVGTLTEGQLRAVREYVENGGSVVLSFGEATALDAVTRQLRSFDVGRARERIVARDLQSVNAIIGEVDLRHPIFEIFSGSGVSTILRPEFRQYVKVEPDSNTTVIAAYDTGDPFLLERRVGNGKVLVYTSTFSTTWTDFALHETFIPFIYQLARYALEGSEQRQVFRVGETIPLRGQPGDEWEVRAPGDRLYKVKVDDQGAGFFKETEEPGHYVAARGREQFFFSVNVDPGESNLQTRDPEEFYAAVMAPARVIADTPEKAAAAIVEEEEARQKFWRYLILIVVALFAFETYYANRPSGVRALVKR